MHSANMSQIQWLHTRARAAGHCVELRAVSPTKSSGESKKFSCRKMLLLLCHTEHR